MPLDKVRGFVLRTVPVGDHDRIVDILTRECGLVTASARGARRTRSPMLAATQEFALSEFNLFTQRGRHFIDNAEMVQSFIELQSDLTRLICAAHLSEVFLDCLRDDTEQPQLYTLWAYMMGALVSPQKDPILVTHTCGLKLMQIAGYEPRLDRCILCQQETLPYWFSFSDCGLVCSRHLNDERSRSAIRMSDGLLSLLRYIIAAPFERVFAFSVDQNVADIFITLSDRYVMHHMEKQYSRLNLLKSTMQDFTGHGP